MAILKTHLKMRTKHTTHRFYGLPFASKIRCTNPRGILLAILILFQGIAPIGADIDPESGRFTYSEDLGDIDLALGQIALYLQEQNLRDGSAYVSGDIESGIVGYQLRYFDDGNHLVDSKDWFSVRRYRIPSEPDTTKPEGYYKSDFMEFIDRGINGIDKNDYYFINGRRFDFKTQPAELLRQYQVQIESGITAYLKENSFEKIVTSLGSEGQTSIKKDRAYDDGSLPSHIVLGIDLDYVFSPIERGSVKLNQAEMIEEIRQRIGFVFSATMEYTDLNGYRFRDLADQVALMQRMYDPIEAIALKLVIDALFDTNSDGIVGADEVSNGYTRFREVHQQLIDRARGQNRRIVLPNEKLERLREEYQKTHNKPYPNAFSN